MISLADPLVATTIINKIELLRGRFDYVLRAATGPELLRAQQRLARTEELLAQIPVIFLDKPLSGSISCAPLRSWAV